MRLAARRFSAGNRYGVQAFGIRSGRRGGLAVGRAQLVVYVSRKARTPVAAVPNLPVISRGRRTTVIPDVVGTGVETLASSSSDAVFSGLHAGAAIRIDASPAEIGSIGSLLAAGTAPTHLVTAGHLFAGGAADATVVLATDSNDGDLVPVGNLVANLLDRSDWRRMGLDDPADVALVALNAEGIAMATRTPRPFLIRGVMGSATVDGVRAQIFSWAAGDFSAQARVSGTPLVAHFSSTARGAYTVSGVLGADPSITEPGNSGSVLVSAADDRLAIGLCVGSFGLESVFEPLERALRALRTKFGPLKGWNNPT